MEAVFVVNENIAYKSFNDMFSNLYTTHKEKAKDHGKVVRKKFTLKAMSNKLHDILDKYVSTEVSLKLPKLKKVGSSESPKIKLPKLTKA